MQRELFEELGLDVTISKPHVFFRKMPFTSKSGEEFISDERYYVVKVPDEKVLFKNMSAGERRLTKDSKWWSIDDIRSSCDKFFTDALDVILENIISDNLPVVPQEI